MSNKRKLILLSIVSIVLILIFVLWGLKSSNWRYFTSTRTPKVIAIVITGGAIGFSSLIFQTITNNRILTPSVLGLDSLYILLQSILVFVFGSTSIFITNNNLNFIISVLLMMVFSSILFKQLFKKESSDIMKLLVMGLIFGTLFQSLSSFVQMVIDPNEFLHIQDKMFASFNNINTDILLISLAIIVGIGLYSFKYLRIWDVLSLGRDSAINLGIDYGKMTKKMLIMVSILISVSTALVGPITFLGLLVVNLSRELLKTFEHLYLIIGATLISIVALIGGQLVVERIMNFGTPVGVVINFIGGIYFIYLLLKENVA